VLARLRAKTQDRRAKTQDRRDTVSVHVNEPRTYQRGDPRRSYFSDLARLTLNRDDTGESRQRLANHAQDVADGMEYRDISRVDGAGGYFVPRAWLIDQYVELARPGRAFGNLVTRQPLPGGTDSINVPKILTGTAVGIQVADNTAVVDVDLTDTFVNAQVCTLAGQEGVAIQLIDQSPIVFDQVVFGDLTAAHATQTDLQCFYGTGSNGQVLGLANTAGIGTIAVSGVTVAGVYSGIANAIQQIHTTRFMPPTVILMHPRRWSWLLAQLDQNQRPLFVPNANGPFRSHNQPAKYSRQHDHFAQHHHRVPRPTRRGRRGRHPRRGRHHQRRRPGLHRRRPARGDPGAYRVAPRGGRTGPGGVPRQTGIRQATQADPGHTAARRPARLVMGEPPT
jgi:HK97 family phage major capsid protein